jgi:hypothetical protein
MAWQTVAMQISEEAKTVAAYHFQSDFCPLCSSFS